MNHNKTEIYSATRFSDLLASPTFYSMSAIAFVLGLSSIFGFLQSPQKLKTAVDTITKKVVLLKQNDVKAVMNISDTTSQRIDRNNTSILSDRYSIFLDGDTKESKEQAPKHSIQTIQLASFNYDITSKHFWGDLDMNNPQTTVFDENTLKNRDSLLIGVPMRLDAFPKTGDEKYSLKLNRNYL